MCRHCASVAVRASARTWRTALPVSRDVGREADTIDAMMHQLARIKLKRHERWLWWYRSSNSAVLAPVGVGRSSGPGSDLRLPTSSCNSGKAVFLEAPPEL